MKRIPARISPQQLGAITKMRALLAEKGYLTYPVSRRLRRHSKDFLAIPKPLASGRVVAIQFALVHPMRDGSIKVRPYCHPTFYDNIKAIVDKVALTDGSALVRWSPGNSPSLPYAGGTGEKSIWSLKTEPSSTCSCLETRKARQPAGL